MFQSNSVYQFAVMDIIKKILDMNLYISESTKIKWKLVI
jgi:hypothetical protein